MVFIISRYNYYTATNIAVDFSSLSIFFASTCNVWSLKQKIKRTLIKFNNYVFLNANSNTYMLAVNVNVISPFASKFICAFIKVIIT